MRARLILQCVQPCLFVVSYRVNTEYLDKTFSELVFVEQLGKIGSHGSQIGVPLSSVLVSLSFYVHH